MGRFCAFLRQSLVVEFAGGFGIQRQAKLILTGLPGPANPPSRVTLNVTIAPEGSVLMTFDVIYPVAPCATVFPAV